MATNTAASFTNHTGNGTAGPFNVSFSYLSEAEVDVTVGGVAKTLSTHYTFTSATQITFTSGNEPGNGVAIKFQRDTNIGAKKVDFVDGSVLTETDLDNNTNQLLFGIQEIADNYQKRDGSQTITGDLVFEGSTDDANETTLSVTNPTADRTITIPDVTGTVVTTGDTGTVTSTMINDGTIATGDLADSLITTAKINADAITGAKIADDQIDSEHIAAGAVDLEHMSANSVDSDQYVDGSIDTAHIGNSQVTTAKIAGQAVTTAKIAPLSVTTAKLVDDAITTVKISNANVTTDKLASQAVTTAKIAPSSVTTAKINDAAVTPAKLADSAVQESKILTQAVTTSKIGSEAVTTPKIADSAISTAKIANSAVTSAKIADGTIVNADINASAAIAGTKISPDFGSQNIVTTGNLTVSGNMTVSGTTTTIDTTTLTVEDKNIELGKVSTPTDTTADGGGLTLKGATDKTFQWLNATDSWTSSEHIALPDNKKLQFGAGNDLEIFSDGTNSIIKESTSNGSLKILGQSILFKNTNDSEVFIDCHLNGNVELYYDNNKKLETTTNGINVYNSGIVFQTTASGTNTFGNIQIPNDNGKIQLGTSQDLQIYHNGTDSVIRDDGTGNLILQTLNSTIAAYVNTNELAAKFISNGAVELYYDNSKKFETTANGVRSQGTDHKFGNGTDNTGAKGNRQRLAILGDTTNGSMLHIRGGSPAIFFDQSNGNFSKIYQDNVNLAFYAGTPVSEGINILTLDDNGNIQIPNDNAKLQLGASQDLLLHHDGTHSKIHTETGNLSLSSVQKVQLSKASGDGGSNYEKMVEANVNSSVDLYFDNSIKFSTTSTGASVTGAIRATGTTALSGTPHTYIFGQGGTGETGLSVRASEASIDLVGDDSGQHAASILLRTTADGMGMVYNPTTNVFAIKTFETTNDNFHISNTGSNVSNLDTQFSITKDAAVKLSYNGNTTIETLSTGARITGGLTCTAATTGLKFSQSSAIITNSGNYFNYKYAADGDTSGQRGISLVGNEPAMEIVADNTGNHTGSFLIRGQDDGFGFLYNQNTSRLEILSFTASADNFTIHAGGSNVSRCDNTISIVENGAVELFYDNSKKFETTSTGASVTGNLDIPDNNKIRFGTSNDLQIYHDGNNSVIKNSTGYLNINSGQFAIGNQDNSEFYLGAVVNQGVELRYDNVKKFETTSAGATVTGSFGIGITSPSRLLHQHVDNSFANYHLFTNSTTGSSSSDGLLLGINATEDGVIWNHEDTALRFATNNTERMTINSSGNVQIPNDNAKLQLGASQDLELSHNGSTTGVIENNVGQLVIRSDEPNSGSNKLWLQSYTTTLSKVGGQEYYLRATQDGSVDLYFDNSLKFKTTSTGALLGDYIVANVNTLTKGVLDLGAQYSNTDGTPKLFLYNDTNAYLGFGISSNQLDVCLSASAYDFVTYQGTTELFRVKGTGHVQIPADDKKLQIGANQDLEIFKDGNHVRIKDNQSANGYATVINSDHLRINNLANTENLARFVKDGAAELFYDNTKRFETLSNGAQIVGIGYIRAGQNSDGRLALYADNGDDNDDLWRINATATGSNLTIDNYAGGSWETNIKAVGNQAVELYYDNSKKLETFSAGLRTEGRLRFKSPSAVTGQQDGRIEWANENEIGIMAKIHVDRTAISLAPSDLVFSTAENVVSPQAQERLRITSGGNIRIPADDKKLQIGASQDLEIYHNGTHSYIEDTKTGTSHHLNIVSNRFQVLNQAKTEHIAKFIEEGAVELYYDNGKRFETTSTGAKVKGGGGTAILDVIHNNGTQGIGIDYNTILTLGTNTDQPIKLIPRGTHASESAVRLYFGSNEKFRTTSDGVRVIGILNLDSHIAMGDGDIIHLGSGNDFRIYHDGTTNYIRTENGSIHIIKSNTENIAKFIPDGAVELYHDNSKKFETTSSGITVTGSVTTQDMNMSNLNGSANEVDNTKGSWSIQEGSNDLFIINRITGKKYKFNLTEIS